MIPGVRRVCLACGVLTLHGSRCEACAANAERIRSKRRGARHYTGDYAKRARAVRESFAPCWICGEWDRPGDPWTADHVQAGDPASPLAKAHRSCNSRRGNRSIER